MSSKLKTGATKKIVGGVIGVALLAALTAGGTVPALAAVATGGDDEPTVTSTGYDCFDLTLCTCVGWIDCIMLRLEHPDCEDWIFQGDRASCTFHDDIIINSPNQGNGPDDEPTSPLDGVTRPSDSGSAQPVDPNVADGKGIEPPPVTIPGGPADGGEPGDPGQGEEPGQPSEPGEGDQPGEPAPPTDPRPSGPTKQLPLPNLPELAL